MDDALKKGRWMVTYPGMLLLFSLLALSIYISTREALPLWTKPVSLILSLVLPWLFWSYRITKWKIWAYTQVTNIHDLQKKAFEAQLIWAPGSFFEKTEFRTKSDRAALEVLNERFNHPDIYEDDCAVSYQTVIKYSANKQFIQFLVYACLAAFSALYVFLTDGQPFVSIILSIAALLFAFFFARQHKTMKRRNASIILNDEGLETENLGFLKWGNISDESVQNFSGNHYFTFYYSEGWERIDIDEYQVQPDALEHLIRTYRARHNEQSKIRQPRQD